MSSSSDPSGEQLPDEEQSGEEQSGEEQSGEESFRHLLPNDNIRPLDLQLQSYDLPGRNSIDFTESLWGGGRPSRLGKTTSRKYITRSLIFDLEDTQDHLIAETTQAIRERLQRVFERYSFLSGHVRFQDGVACLHRRHRPEDQLPFSRFASEVFQSQTCYGFMSLKSEDLRLRRFPPYLFHEFQFFHAHDPVNPNIGDPALLVQADFYVGCKPGFLILSFRLHHGLADKRSFATLFTAFVGHWQSKPQMYKRPLGVLKYQREAPPPIDEFPEWDFDFTKTSGPCYLLTQTKSIILVMPAARLDQLKQQVKDVLVQYEKDEYFTIIDCVSAWCWMAITRARLRKLNAEDMTNFTTDVDYKLPLIWPLPGDIRENMTISTLASAKIHHLLGLPSRGSAGDSGLEMSKDDKPFLIQTIAGATLCIRAAINSVNTGYLRKRLHTLSEVEAEKASQVSRAFATKLNTGATGVRFRSLVDAGAHHDFGLPNTTNEGRPVFCRKNWGREEGVATVLPRRFGTLGTENWEIQICLDSEDLRELLASRAWKEFSDECGVIS